MGHSAVPSTAWGRAVGAAPGWARGDLRWPDKRAYGGGACAYRAWREVAPRRRGLERGAPRRRRWGSARREACGLGVPWGDPRRRVAGVLQLAAALLNRARHAVPQAPAPTGEPSAAAISSLTGSRVAVLAPNWLTFGLLLANPGTGRRRTGWARIVVLRDARRCFVWPRMRQRVDAVLRRSEAAALTWADIERAADGSGRVTVYRSKTDQAGQGAIPGHRRLTYPTGGTLLPLGLARRRNSK